VGAGSPDGSPVLAPDAEGITVVAARSMAGTTRNWKRQCDEDTRERSVAKKNLNIMCLTGAQFPGWGRRWIEG
jgi:hypothetical protein